MNTGHVILLATIVALSVMPPVIAWVTLRRWPWMGLKVTPSTAFPYAYKAIFLMAIPSVVLLGVGTEYAIGLAALIGLFWMWRRSIVFDLWNVRGVMHAAIRGDRTALVHRGESTTARLLRFGDLSSAKIISSVSHFLWEAGAQNEAEKLIAQVPIERYVGVPFWHLLHTLTLHRLKLGKYDDAERALDRCGSADPPTKDLDRQHRYFRGLVDAASGKPKRALNRMEGDEAPERDVVALHAYAALGKDEKAMSALERLKKMESGDVLLEQIAKGHGPGKAFVLRALGKELPTEDHDGPYR